MKYDDDVSRLLDAGNESFDAGDFESALHAFVAAVDAGAEGYRINIGNTLKSLGRTADAIDAYRVGWQLGDPDIGWNLAVTLREIGETEEAAVVEQALFADRYPFVVLTEAWNRRDAGDLDGAEQLLRSILGDSDSDSDSDEGGESDSDDPASIGSDHAAGVLGMWLRQGGDSGAETERLLRRGMIQYDSARVELAWLLFSDGREDEGVRLLEEGVARGEANSLIPLGNHRWDAGRLDEARELFERGVALGDRNAADNLAHLLRHS